jgi:AbrB family looped-hinge helix DNA binding protein
VLRASRHREVDSKSNEITAIPELPDTLHLDAMGCHKDARLRLKNRNEDCQEARAKLIQAVPDETATQCAGPDCCPGRRLINTYGFTIIVSAMGFTTVVSTKGQVTLPKKIRDHLKITAGAKIDIYPIPDGFVGRVRGPLKIMDFFGDLQKLDGQESLKAIRSRAQETAAEELADD